MRAWLVIMVLMLSPLSALAADVSGKTCDVTVMFNSVCCGTDFNAYQNVKKILDADPTISVRRNPWGMEGEFSLCLNTMNDNQVKPLYDKIKAVLPEKPAPSRGTTTVEMKIQ